MSTRSLVFPSYHGGSITFHKENLLSLRELYFHILLWVNQKRELKQRLFNRKVIVFYNSLKNQYKFDRAALPEQHEGGCGNKTLSFFHLTHVPALIAVPRACKHAHTWLKGQKETKSLQIKRHDACEIITLEGIW